MTENLNHTPVPPERWESTNHTPEPPERCRRCYWLNTGCMWWDGDECEYHTPMNDIFMPDWPELEYDPGPETDYWGRYGFEVFEDAKELGDYFRSELDEGV